MQSLCKLPVEARKLTLIREYMKTPAHQDSHHLHKGFVAPFIIRKVPLTIDYQPHLNELT